MSRNQGETINKIITTDWRQFPLCKWPLRIVASGDRDEARAAATGRAIKLANWLTDCQLADKELVQRSSLFVGCGKLGGR